MSSFKVPTDIARLSDAELAELIAEGSAEFDALLALDNPADQDVIEAERISPLLKQLEAETQRRQAAATGRVDRMNAVREAHQGEPTPEPEPPEPGEPPEPPADYDGPYAEDLIQAAEESDEAFQRRMARYPRTPNRGAPAATPRGGPQHIANTTRRSQGIRVRSAADNDNDGMSDDDLIQGVDESDEEFARRMVSVPASRRAARARRQQPMPMPNTPPINAPNGMSIIAANGTEVLPANNTISKVAHNIPRPVRPQRYDGDIIITASADVPDFATGSRVGGIPEIAQMTVNRMKGFPQPAGIKDGQMHQYGICTLRPNFPEELICGRQEDDWTVVTRAASEARLPGGSLVAAGGWCAPSEVLYALCEAETTEGLLSLPEIQVTRGGIRYTRGPDFSTIYQNSGFCFTEAQIMGGATKPCYEVPCPPFEEVRLDACGVCIKVPILTNAAYPELVQRVIRGALVAFQHQINAKLLAAMASALGPAVAIRDYGGTFIDTVGMLELLCDAIRTRYRLGLRETLEVVAPFWLQGAIQNDLANRTGFALSPEQITDDYINMQFAARLMNIQWVYDWQDLMETCPTDYPATAEVMVYPAGTFVKGVADVINLNAVYDAASLSQNFYTGLFMEQGILLAHTCFTGCLAEIPVCNAGRTGAHEITCGTAA